MIVAAGVSNVGCVRSHNEDFIFWADPSQRVFIVADGMGGENAGEVASELAVQALWNCLASAGDPAALPFYDDSINPEESRLIAAMGLANREVRRKAAADPDCANMGTTIVAVSINGAIATFGSVGDCRAYLWRASQMKQMTTDDTVIQELLDAGEIVPEDIPAHPLRHVVTAAIGAAESLSVQTLEAQIESGDRILLCSDGLHGVLPDEEIAQILGQGTSVQDSANALIGRTLERGAPDNVSCVLIEYRGDDGGPV